MQWRLNVAREAWGGVAGLLVVALALYAAGSPPLAVMTLAVTGVTAWLFRDPRLKAPYSPLDITSPCHGVCTRVSFDYDPWVERRARRVDIDMGPFSSYRIYAPTEAKIVDVRHRRNGPRSRCIELWLKTDEHDDVVFRLAQTWPARFRLDYAPGERIGHGRPIGFAPLGARCTLLMPESVTDVVETGSEVAAPITALARLDPDAASRRERERAAAAHQSA